MRGLVRDEDFESQNARFARVLSGERVERIETQWVHKDGTLLDVVLTASPLRDRSGEVIGASAVVHDITARKRDEAELRRSHAELERFADIAAHDLREPLMAITQLTALLERGVDSQRAEIIAHLRAAAAHGSRLVDGLLDLARVGRGAPPAEPVDLRRVLEGLLDTLAPQIEAAGAQVDVGPLPAVRGVEGELARVFQNLLANALKFRGAAPPVVAVERRAQPARVDAHRGRQRPRRERAQPRAHLRALRPRPGRRRGAGDRPRAGRVPQGRRAPRRAHLGRARAGRRAAPSG